MAESAEDRNWLAFRGGCSAFAIATLLVLSAQDKRLSSRISFGIAITLCLALSFIPVFSYFNSFGDYPWWVLIPSLVGGILAGQRIIAVSLVVLMGYWLQGAYMPARTSSR